MFVLVYQDVSVYDCRVWSRVLPARLLLVLVAPSALLHFAHSGP